MTNLYGNATVALPDLLRKVLNYGDETESRNGKTKELTMQQVKLLNPDLYITTPGRRVSLPAQIAETMWILSGRNDIDWISHYLPRAAEFSDDNKVWRGGYGPRLRTWVGTPTWEHPDQPHVDQLEHVVNLLKEDPETRRAVFNIYNPAIDTQPGKDIPCNNWVHFLPREGVLHGHVAIRSNDLFWGWSGINAFEWTALLQVVAGLTGLKPGSLTFSISSLHLYERHWGRASDIVSQSAGADLGGFEPSPTFTWTGDGIEDFDALVSRWFDVESLIRKNAPSTARAIQAFPEPLMRSWLWALVAWNWNDLALAGHLKNTALFEALANSPKKKMPSLDPKPVLPEVVLSNRAKFTVFATNLHKEKNAAYGDSWKKRGEMLGIMANIARKVDRLGVPGGGDTAADTAIDLMMYLIKYDLWLRQQAGAQDAPTEGQSHVAAVDLHLQYLETNASTLEGHTNDSLIASLRAQFDNLEHLVEEKRANRGDFVRASARDAYVLATRLWAHEEWKKGNEKRSWNPEPLHLTEAEKAMGLDGK